MQHSVLVIGGTGPTGPYLLAGLLERGFDVTILHRGTHEPDGLPEVRHIHGDPHFAHTIEAAVGNTSFDVVVAAYGRTRLLAEAFAGRTGHFVALGGVPRYAGFYEPRSLVPSGPAIPVSEDAPLATDLAASASPAIEFAQRMVQTELAVSASHPSATLLIYPVVYGPRNVWPREWSIVKRILDGRRAILVPDEGLAIHSRGAARNMASAVLSAIDQPQVSAGQVYNCADDVQYNVRQWVELIASCMSAEIEVAGIPAAVAPMVKAVHIPSTMSVCDQMILDTGKVRGQLGYHDVVSPKQALMELVEWYAAHPIAPTDHPAGFVDTFDYPLEDRLLVSWKEVVGRFAERFEQQVPADVHPMPHPRAANLLVDEKAR